MWIDEREEKDRSLGGLTLKTSPRAAEKHAYRRSVHRDGRIRKN